MKPAITHETGRTQAKRLSKSERLHRRRVKQAARKAAAAGSAPTGAILPVRMPA